MKLDRRWIGARRRGRAHGRRCPRMLTAAALAVVFLTCVACLTEVSGERAESGECPSGEVCSERTPRGLEFVGAGFFDDETLRLGPVLAGGRFDLGIRNPAEDGLPPYRIEIESPGLLSAREGEGIFGPLDEEGEPLHPVDAFVTLEGLAPGETRVRVVDTSDGSLYDRIAIEVYEVEEVTLVNVRDPQRETLRPGTEELLGIRLLTEGGSKTLRAIDQDVDLRAEGEIQPENLYWDCFTYTVPEGATQVEFEIEAAGQLTFHTMSVLP